MGGGGGVWPRPPDGSLPVAWVLRGPGSQPVVVTRRSRDQRTFGLLAEAQLKVPLGGPEGLLSRQLNAHLWQGTFSSQEAMLMSSFLAPQVNVPFSYVAHSVSPEK